MTKNKISIGVCYHCEKDIFGKCFTLKHTRITFCSIGCYVKQKHDDDYYNGYVNERIIHEYQLSGHGY